MKLKVLIALSTLLLTFGVSKDIEFTGSNKLLDSTFYTYSLNAKDEKCEVMYKNNETLTDETCISLTNSKGVNFNVYRENLKDFYAEKPISLKMKGNYHDFGAFVSGVASLPRVVILTMHDLSCFVYK